MAPTDQIGLYAIVYYASRGEGGDNGELPVAALLQFLLHIGAMFACPPSSFHNLWNGPILPPIYHFSAGFVNHSIHSRSLACRAPHLVLWSILAPEIRFLPSCPAGSSAAVALGNVMSCNLGWFWLNLLLLPLVVGPQDFVHMINSCFLPHFWLRSLIQGIFQIFMQ